MVPPEVDPARAPVRLVERAEELEALAAHIRGSQLAGLDVEANSLHAYRERACVLQVTAGGVSAIVDVLALGDLRALRDALDTHEVEVVLHGGDYDVTLLSRDHDFVFHRVFDTMVAATLLGEEKVGLANLVREAWGVDLDKRFQRADWARRPLTPEQIDYLHRDTVYLPGLYDLLRARLVEADLLEEAEIEFRWLAARRGKPLVRNAEGWRRIKGSARLGEKGRAVLAEIHDWREEEAERRDVPPFKVLPPSVMLALAEAPPAAARNPGEIRTLPPRTRQRYGRVILDAVRRGTQRARKGRAPMTDVRKRLTPEEVARHQRGRSIEEALRDWRRKEARGRKVPNLVVLPNRALVWLAREAPTTVPALATCGDIGEKRMRRYGETIVGIVRSART